MRQARLFLGSSSGGIVWEGLMSRTRMPLSHLPPKPKNKERKLKRQSRCSRRQSPLRSRVLYVRRTVRPCIGWKRFHRCFSDGDIWMCTLRAPSCISQSACSSLTCLNQTWCRACRLLNRCSAACLFMVFYELCLSPRSHAPFKHNSCSWPVVVSRVLHKRLDLLFSLCM